MEISGVDAVSRISGAYRVYFHLNNRTTNSLPLSRTNFPQNPAESNPRSWQIGSFHSIFNFLINNEKISKEIVHLNKSNEGCNLCQNRRYICSNGETSDGKSTIIPGQQSALRVQHHEAQ
ncbi:MAG: hypothetical protein AB1422_19055, partial [bacterium]